MQQDILDKPLVGIDQHRFIAVVTIGCPRANAPLRSLGAALTGALPTVRADTLSKGIVPDCAERTAQEGSARNYGQMTADGKATSPQNLAGCAADMKVNGNEFTREKRVAVYWRASLRGKGAT